MNSIVSVIVPLFNNEDRIERCMESILHQTYQNIELIIINDGSTDKSEEKILSIKDTRIRYVFQENSGPSVARNKGIDLAKGDYIVFIDSDDYIENDMIDEMYNAAVQNNAEIVNCNIYKKIAENSFLELCEPYSFEETWQEFYENFLLHNGLCSLCNKLFKKSLLHNIRLFEDIRLGEDSSALLRMLPSAKKIIHINKPFYIYDLTHEGISRNAKKNVYEYKIAITRVLDFYKHNDVKLPLPDYFLRLKVCYYTLFFCSLKKAKRIAYWDYFKLAEDFYKDYPLIRRDPSFKKLALKFKLFTIFYNLSYFIFFRNFYLNMEACP